MSAPGASGGPQAEENREPYGEPYDEPGGEPGGELNLRIL